MDTLIHRPAHKLACAYTQHTQADAQVLIHTYLHIPAHVSTCILTYPYVHSYQLTVIYLCTTTHMPANIYRSPCTLVETHS